MAWNNNGLLTREEFKKQVINGENENYKNYI